MKKLQPSGYKTWEETMKPGYLKERMKLYRAKVEAEKKVIVKWPKSGRTGW